MAIRNTTLDDLAVVIGFSATVRLSAWFGDSDHNLYVPPSIDEGMLLAQLIGLAPAKRIAKEWPGEWIAIPRMQAFEEDARKRFIGRMLERGFSTKEIASRLRMSERRVQQICRELEALGLIEIVVPRAREKKPPEKAPAKTVAKNAGQKSPRKTVGKIASAKEGSPWKI